MAANHRGSGTSGFKKSGTKSKKKFSPASGGAAKKPHRKGVSSQPDVGRKPRHGQLNRAQRRAEQFGDDRPRRFDRDDRAPRSDRDGRRPARVERADRPQRFERDDRRPARFERDDRPQRFDRDDRGPARFDRDDRRPARVERADRPQRFDRDDRRPARVERADRPQRFDRDDRRPARVERADRPQRFDRDDRRPARFDRDDRPQRPTRDDRPRRFERTDRFDERRPSRHQHVAGHSDFRRQDREDRAPRSTFLSRADEEAAVEGSFDELAPVGGKTAVEVGDDNGFAAMGIPQPVVDALAQGGINAPFAIQVEAIPSALAGEDVLARAATGSGKTLAFGLPTLTRLNGGQRVSGQPRGLVLTPTRELAMQIVEALAPLGKTLGLRTLLVAGGMPYKKQLDALSNGVDLLIATPGRLIDLIERGAADLSGVEISILDEADQMCDMGFAPEVRRILEETPQGSQRMMFSATLDGDVDVLVKRFLKNPVLHSTADVGASVESMEHHLFVVHPARKAAVVAELASRPGRSIVFVRTKMGADRVAEKMREAGVNALAIHGGLSQGQRTRALNAFRGNDVPVLVATDVAARGIHIDDVELVIQADPPQEHKTYLHRAGRTARAGDEGTVVTLAMPRERRNAERLTGQAGLDIRGVYVEPGDQPITAITGGAQPSGEPVEEFRPPVKTNPRRGHHRDNGPRRGGRPAGGRDARHGSGSRSGGSGDRSYGGPRRPRRFE